MRKLALQLTLAALAALPTFAQKPEKPPKRPKLEAMADTNDAREYMDYGFKKFDDDPEAAASAFYWAARINPDNAEAYYARRAALILDDNRLLSTYIDGSTHDKETLKPYRALDTLELRATLLNPFLYRRLEARIFTDYIGGLNHMSPGDAQLHYVINTYLQNAGASTRAWVAYSDGDFDTALEQYATAMKGDKQPASTHLERARIFGMRAQTDSAVAEFKSALDELRKKDAKSLVFVYDSKATIEHSIGMLLEGHDRPAEAREAYGRALQEDVSFYPAHVRLGMLALGAKDSTTAVSELDLAAQIAPNEPYVRYTYGYTLAALGKRPEALTQINKAIELDPYYPLPYVTLAEIQEKNGDHASARAAYQAYLKHAGKQDPQRTDVEAKLLAMAPQTGGAGQPR
ncbi:MAG TPA: tetratricopeptide repeat protein [Gemmatimonadaceae bacterium]|jgi:Tfp pilus assembly protein PilF